MSVDKFKQALNEISTNHYVLANVDRDAKVERQASYIRENSQGRITAEGIYLTRFSFHVSI